VSPRFHLNHVGFGTGGAKRILVNASAALTRFQLIRTGDDQVRFEGALTPVGAFGDWGEGGSFFVADFSGFTEPGTYTLYVNGTRSPSFEIGNRLLFARTMKNVLGYFRASRADDADVWGADASVGFVGRGGTADVRGGWYDASGDISKYLSHLSYANYLNPQQIPLVAWALAWVVDEGRPLITQAGLETDVRSEALWGADYLVRVLDPSGYFYATVFDGWTGKLEERRICAFTGSEGARNGNYAAAFREGGGLSVAALARIARWNQAGAFPATKYLEAAERGYAYLESNNTQLCDNGQENVIDDYAALLAASELFGATRKPSYLTSARARAGALMGRLHATGYFIADQGTRPFWHASDAGLPVIALTRYLELEADASRAQTARDAIGKHLDYLLRVTQEVTNPFGYARQHVSRSGSVQSSFFIPQKNESNYWYQGENARLASLATAAVLGGRVARPDACGPLGIAPALAAYAEDQVGWILGKNPRDICFLKGSGRNNPPNYCGDKRQGGSHVGGIANGYTSQREDGGGIEFATSFPPGPKGEDQCWMGWRWVEQWLPHSAWYMLAITAMARAEAE
jgi:hypothetical protein